MHGVADFMCSTVKKRSLHDELWPATILTSRNHRDSTPWLAAYTCGFAFKLRMRVKRLPAMFLG